MSDVLLTKMIFGRPSSETGSSPTDRRTATPSNLHRTPQRTNEELKNKVENKLMTMWNNVKFGKYFSIDSFVL